MASSPIKVAKRKVRRKKIFYYHFTIFLIVSTFLFSINILTDPFPLWFQFPVLIWSLPLAFHFLFAIGNPFYEADEAWEKREIEKELQKMSPRTLSSPTINRDSDEELELRDFKELRKEWKDQDFV